RRRLTNAITQRGPPAPAIWTNPPANYTPAPNWGGPPSTLQLVLENTSFTYDAVDNPTVITDGRTADEWPAGAKPVSRAIQYDDLYRVTRVDYQYTSGDDTWVDPFYAEDNGVTDPRRATPSPRVSFDQRPHWQTFQYDALGNTIA